ncbi:MAG: hypothetical protein EA384_01730 [Spirochaetaceae bacterium]|nr:MAG: hypothetical protein EA384_01730 [Spirochaetaceae bacterium]
MNRNMTEKERLDAVFSLSPPDRTPVLGGWIACPDHIMQITGVDEDAYWNDPQGISLRAYQSLGTDGLVGVFVPTSRDGYRCVDHTNYARSDKGASLEDTVAEIDAMPSPERIEAEFDFDSSYAEYRQSLQTMRERCGGMVWMPANWSAGARISWYGQFGYENFFLVVGMYPDRAQKLMEVGGVQGRCHSRLVARAVQEGLYPHAVLLGEDICTQRGPMISVDFMERYYAPQLRYGLAPLLEVGCRPIWHCDGDVRLLLDFLIDSGVQGLQGFQPECGMLLEEIVTRRTPNGEPLVIFGPLAVTTELPVCTPEEIMGKVRRAIEICEGNASLVLFTSNTINPDVPLRNIEAMYEAVKS